MYHFGINHTKAVYKNGIKVYGGVNWVIKKWN
jgi:hypothetical protein